MAKIKRNDKAEGLGSVSGRWILLGFTSRRGRAEHGSLGLMSRDIIPGQGSSRKKLEHLSEKTGVHQGNWPFRFDFMSARQILIIPF